MMSRRLVPVTFAVASDACRASETARRRPAAKGLTAEEMVFNALRGMAHCQGEFGVASAKSLRDTWPEQRPLAEGRLNGYDTFGP